jgi:hypothetical protein
LTCCFLSAQALSQLRTLGAIDPAGYVTALGRQMSSFPLEPNLARMLIESATRFVLFVFHGGVRFFRRGNLLHVVSYALSLKLVSSPRGVRRSCDYYTTSVAGV